MIGKMVLRYLILIVAIFCLTNTSMSAQSNNKKEVTTVDSVDLQKYIGKWYEIAKIPNSFQSNCARNTTAKYKLRSDGRLDVINRCVEKDGSVNEAHGIAKVVDKKTNSKLEVSFVRILGINLFWGDYWIIGLDKDYNYAVVGTPSRKYGWILSRTPKLSKEQMKSAFKILQQNGYDTNKFELTEQTY
jgi:apolipoprotein D and lipocalin family protein